MISHSTASRKLAEDTTTQDAMGLMFGDAWQSFARVRLAIHSGVLVVFIDFFGRRWRQWRSTTRARNQPKRFVRQSLFLLSSEDKGGTVVDIPRDFASHTIRISQSSTIWKNIQRKLNASPVP